MAVVPFAREESFEVVVVGAGLTGCVLASLLRKAGVKVGLVAAGPRRPHAGQPRIVALARDNRDLLVEADAWPSDESACGRFSYMEVWDEGSPGRLFFDAQSVHADAFAYTLDSTPLVDDMRSDLLQVDAYVDVQVESLRKDGFCRAVVLDNGITLEAPLLVAADGARSPVRQLAGIEVAGDDYDEHALTTIIRCQRPHGNVARQRFLHSGPVALLPLAQPDTVSLVWSNSAAQVQQLVNREVSAFESQLGDAVEHCLGTMQVQGDRLSWPLSRRQASAFAKARVALVGDAAHVVHPLAGQGANLGLRDVRTLVELVLAERSHGRDIGAPRVLDAYSRRRRAANRAMGFAIDRIGRVFLEQDMGVPWLRGAGMRLLDRVEPAKAAIVRYAAGL